MVRLIHARTRLTPDLIKILEMADPDMGGARPETKFRQGGFRVDASVSEARLRKYVGMIPHRFYDKFNGSLAERILDEARLLQAVAMFTSSEHGDNLDKRVTLDKPTLKKAVGQVIVTLRREEQATNG